MIFCQIPSSKRARLKRSFLLIWGILASLSGYAQFSYKLEGTVKHDGKPLSGAIVSIYDFDNNKVKDLVTTASGGFTFALKVDEEYNIFITKEGFITAKLMYSTIGIAPEDAKKFKDVSRPEIEIFEMPSDPKLAAKVNDLLNKPLLSFYYSSEDHKMIGDESSNHTEDLARLKKEAEGPKAAAAEAAELEAKYKALIAKADNAFTGQTYAAAKAAYNEALALKPAEAHPKARLAEIEKLIAAEAAEKQRLAKEKAEKEAAEKERLAKERSAAEAAEAERLAKIKAAAEEKLAKEKAAADAAEAARLEKEKAALEAKEKERLAREAADKEAAEKARLLKEKADEEAAEKARLLKEAADKEAAEKARLAKEKADAEAAEKERLAQEAAAKDAALKEKLAKEKAAAEAAEAEHLAKEKAEAEAREKARLAKEAAEKEAAEKERLAKEAEAKALQEKYDALMTKGDAELAAKKYPEAKTTYAEAAALKPKEAAPKDKIAEVDKIVDAAKKAEYTNEYARKYPEGVTEEKAKEGNANITRRIVVQGNKGFLYVKKETSFGTFYFKDGVTITEAEWKKETETK